LVAVAHSRSQIMFILCPPNPETPDLCPSDNMAKNKVWVSQSHHVLQRQDKIMSR
jgi:hypothetical protein